MSWFLQLDKHRGSRPRCVLMVDGMRAEVADRLTKLVNLPGVEMRPDDSWMPRGKPVFRDGFWDKAPAQEVELDKPNVLVRQEIQLGLGEWWLAVRGRGSGGRTPNWDIASKCLVKGRPGLLLVEAKAHLNELEVEGIELKESAPLNSQRNHERIGLAIAEASKGLASASGKPWGLSRDHHYQLSNRFAWSWRLASLGVPVVLVYLGFLNAQDMAEDGPLFRREADWTRAMEDYSRNILDAACWERWLDFAGTPFIAVVRAIDQPFDSRCR